MAFNPVCLQISEIHPPFKLLWIEDSSQSCNFLALFHSLVKQTALISNIQHHCFCYSLSDTLASIRRISPILFLPLHAEECSTGTVSMISMHRIQLKDELKNLSICATYQVVVACLLFPHPFIKCLHCSYARFRGYREEKKKVFCSLGAHSLLYIQIWKTIVSKLITTDSE